ncbi:MAG TPA: oxidase [Lichenihabitans sp.]|nr:oxidase [Lichenihabitans sp.]
MSDASRSAHPATTRKGVAAAWRRNGIVWLVLLALQAGSLAGAYASFGHWALPLDVGIGAVMVLIVGIFTMGLEKTTALNRLTAAAGFVFVLVMFALTLGDVYTRL